MRKQNDKPILSVTRKDCILLTTRGSGAGGQHRNKTDSCVTWKHPPSGAEGYSCDSKSQLTNKRVAWRRLAESKEMQLWIKMQAGGHAVVESRVAAAMRPGKLLVEGKDEQGRWSREAME